MNEKLISLGAMATRAGVPRTWLRDEAYAGRIPHLAAGSRLLFCAEDVERVLIERARGAMPLGPEAPDGQRSERASEPEARR